MPVLWNSIREVAPTAFELLASEMRPANALTALTLINVFVVYSMRGPASPQSLVTVWAIQTANLVLWTFCTLTLHFAGLP